MNRRVLIVDDDASVRESLKKVLEAADYEVVLAADGPQADLRFVPEQIHLVLLDLNLAGESGWEVFDRLTTRYPLTPIIIITGLPNRYPTALAAGAGALMEKPIEVPVLLKTMSKLLAEPKETLLRRLCGYMNDTLHVPPAGAPGGGATRQRLRTPAPRLRLRSATGWRAG